MDHRSELVQEHHGLLCRLASRLVATNEQAKRSGEWDDWYQEAAIALFDFDADSHFDDSYGVEYEAWAAICVWDKLRSLVRRHGNLIHVPTSASSDTSKYAEQADAAFAIRSLHAVGGYLSPYCDLPAPELPEAMLGGDQVALLLRVLDKRSADLIRKRYGFDGPPRTLQELSDEMGITKERIRQIERRALARMEGVPLTL